MSQENDSLFNFSLPSFGFGASPPNAAGECCSVHLHAPALIAELHLCTCTDSGTGFVFGKAKPTGPPASRSVKKPLKIAAPTAVKPSAIANKAPARDTNAEASSTEHPLASAQGADLSQSQDEAENSPAVSQNKETYAEVTVGNLRALVAKLEASLEEQNTSGQHQREAANDQIKSLQADLSTGKKIQSALTKELKVLQKTKSPGSAQNGKP